MGLREKITETGALRAWSGGFPVAFRYTAGVAGERFFQTLRARGRFAVTRCDACDVTYLPPRIYCPRCFDDLSERWKDVAPQGVVHTFAVVRADLDGRPLAQPRVVGFVAIDGTDGGLLVPLGLPPDRVQIGLPVKAVLVPPARRRGTIEDIRHFA